MSPGLRVEPRHKRLSRLVSTEGTQAPKTAIGPLRRWHRAALTFRWSVLSSINAALCKWVLSIHFEALGEIYE